MKIAVVGTGAIGSTFAYQLASAGHAATVVARASPWAMSRTAMLRDLGKLGPAEPRLLIDMIAAAVPAAGPPLLAIRP